MTNWLRMLIKNYSIIKFAWLAAFAVSILISCDRPHTPTQQFALRLGFYEEQSNLPYLVMLENGLDKKNGLRFEKLTYAGGAAIIEAMVKGLVDVGYIGSVPALVAADRGLVPDKVVTVAANNFADPEHPNVAVITKLSINSWKDLEGQLIGIHAINSISGAAIKGRLKQEGVSDYKLVEISFANMGLAVVGGNVAAAILTEPFLTQSLLRGDGKLLGWIVGGHPFEHMEYTLIVFRGETHRNSPDAVKAFLRAHLEAVAWINKNPEKSRLLLTKGLDLSKEVGQKIKLLRWPPDARNDPVLLESMQPLMIEIGMLKAPIMKNLLFDETLLEAILREK